MKTINPLFLLLVSGIFLCTASCKKDPKPAPVCKLIQSVDEPESNVDAKTINYTWNNGNISKAEIIAEEEAAVFTYNGNNKISNYKTFTSTNPVPAKQYNFNYNNDNTYSKIDYYLNGKLNRVYEFQNTNGRISKIIEKKADINGQVGSNPSAEYEFNYTDNNVTRIILTRADGLLGTYDYSYDNQPNNYKKIHEQFSIMDYSQATSWTLRLNKFFLSENQNNCIKLSTKAVLNNEPIEETSEEFIYKPDGKGNLYETTDASGHVIGNYTYECN